jgi:hypothetical protein
MPDATTLASTRMASTGPPSIIVRALSVLLACTAIAAGAGACRSRPKPGDACHVPDRLVCIASDRAAACDAASWREIPCRGPRGCGRRGDDADRCDDTLAGEGDACPRNPSVDYACSRDRSAALVCRDGRFDLWRRCRGANGCSILGEQHLDCDTTLGEAGDPCEKEETFACSVDRHVMLECDGHTFVAASTCRGSLGCHFDAESHKVECADGVAVEGDPCIEPDRITCGSDGKSELICVGKRYAKKRECRRTDCHVDGSELYCD